MAYLTLVEDEAVAALRAHHLATLTNRLMALDVLPRHDRRTFIWTRTQFVLTFIARVRL